MEKLLAKDHFNVVALEDDFITVKEKSTGTHYTAPYYISCDPAITELYGCFKIRDNVYYFDDYDNFPDFD